MVYNKRNPLWASGQLISCLHYDRIIYVIQNFTNTIYLDYSIWTKFWTPLSKKTVKYLHWQMSKTKYLKNNGFLFPVPYYFIWVLLCKRFYFIITNYYIWNKENDCHVRITISFENTLIRLKCKSRKVFFISNFSLCNFVFFEWFFFHSMLSKLYYLMSQAIESLSFIFFCSQKFSW